MNSDNIIVPVSVFLAISGAIFTFSKVNTLTDVMTEEVTSIKKQINELTRQNQSDIDEIRNESYQQRVRIYDTINQLRNKINSNSIHLGRIETKLDLIFEEIKRQKSLENKND
jgi:hypothetical protein